MATDAERAKDAAARVNDAFQQLKTALNHADNAGVDVWIMCDGDEVELTENARVRCTTTITL